MSTKYPGFSAEQEAALEAIVATAVSKVEGETAQAGLKAQLADAGKTIERQERTIAEMKEAMDKDKKKNQDEMASAVEAKVTAEAKAADLEKQIADQKTELETVQASLKEKAEALDKIGFDQKVDQAWASLKEKHGFDEKLRADKEPLLRKQLSGEGLSLEDMEKLFAGAKPKGSTVAPPAPAAPTAANRTPLSTVAASTDLTTEPDLKLVAQNFPAATRLSGVR
jgi:murein L,D-transpeptidase YcbB/YkuD